MANDDQVPADAAPEALGDLVSASKRRYQTSEERAADVIRRAILAGTFAPGERLPQTELAEAMDISRIPIRSALRTLESEGLVRFLPHRGVVVSSLTAGERGELYELRAVIESHAIRRSVARATPAALHELRDIVDRVDDSAAPADVRLEARSRFYQLLYGAGNGVRVVDTIMRLRAEAGHQLLGARIGEYAHAELLELVASGDADGAAGFIEDHLRKVAQELAAAPPDPSEPTSG